MKKKEIVFDPEKRKNFLTGFRKRKNERRARAKEQLERSIKEERKRIRNDVKNSMASMKKTFQPLALDPELEDKFLEKEYEDEEVEINVIELATSNTKMQDDQDDSDNASNISETNCEGSYINTIPGMDFNTGVDVKVKENKSKPKQTENRSLENYGKIGNKKMLDKMKKRKALKEFKKSKIFKQKERVEKKKQQKSRRDKNYSKSDSNGTPSGGKSRNNRTKRGHGHASSRGRRK